MDIDELLKNIVTFVEEILPKAYYSSEWDQENIMDACQWATFCEKIYEYLTNEPTSNEYKEIIMVINKCMQRNDTKCLSFDDLKNATSLILKAFFENPFIENELLEPLFCKINKEKPQFLEVLNETSELDSLCVELIDALRPLSFVNSERSLYYEIKAELFLNFLVNSSKHLNTEIGIEEHLSNLLKELTKDNEKMNILVHLILLEIEEKEIKEVQEFTLNWLLLKLSTNEEEPLTNFFWKQSPSKLCTIAEKFPTFYEFYTHFLIKSINLLSNKENNISNYSDFILSFEDIVGHFHILLKSSENISCATKELLKEALNNRTNESHLWQKICSQVS